MQRTKMWGAAFAMGAVLALTSAQGFAHGDVTPHPVETTGLKPLGMEWAASNPYRGDAKAVELGGVGYLHNCAGCHGLNAVTGGVAPDLLLLDKDCLDMADKKRQEACLKDTDDYFKAIVLEGKKTSDGRVTMPGYNGVFTQEAVWAVKAYIDARTVEEKAKIGK
jgi:cytochrome c-550 PedF